MKVCPYCGRYCDDNALTCANCGGNLPQADQNNPYAQQNPYQNAPNAYQNPPYGQQAPYQNAPYGQQAPVRSNTGGGKMPNKGLHLTLTILGFLLGVLWGILCIGPYTNMKNAIANGDAYEARSNAKKIKIFFFVGLAVNVLIIMIRVGQGG